MNILSTRCPFCLRITVRKLTSPATAISAKQIKRSERKVKSISKEDRILQPPHALKGFDLVSAADPDSNIRRVIFRAASSTKEDQHLREQQLSTCEWNDHFWKQHNLNFFEEKKKFIEQANVTSGSGKEVSDKLSIFYKEFLEKNNDIYSNYNREWYRRNFQLLWMSFRASLPKILPWSKT